MSLTELMEAGIIRANEPLTATYLANSYRGRVLADGQIEVLPSGRIYTSPSLAANALTNGHKNGWRFWYVAREGHAIPLADLRDQLGA